MVYLYLFFTIIFWTLGQFFLKIGFTRSNPVSSFVLCGVTGFAVGLPFFYFADIKPDFSDPWRFGAISVWAAMCYLTYYYAIDAGELAIASALVGTCPIWTALFAVFVMGETLVTRQWLAVGAVVTGIMFLAIGYRPETGSAELSAEPAPFNNANISKVKWWACVFISITCAVLTGVADAVTRVVVVNKSVSTHLIYYWSAQIVIGLILKAAIERQKFTFSALFSKYTIIGMFAMNMGAVCFISSMSLEQVSVVETFSSAYVGLVALASWYFLGEKFNALKWFSIVLMLGGVIFIV